MIWKEYERDVGLVSAAVRRPEGRAGNCQEKGIGEKLYHRGIVYVYFLVFCDSFAVREGVDGSGVPFLFLYCIEVIRHFSGVDVQLSGD